MGLTYDNNASSSSSGQQPTTTLTSEAHTSSGGDHPEAAGSGYAPPWAENDLIFEAPRDVFTSFQQETEIPPPLEPQHIDPWTEAVQAGYGPRRNSPRGRNTHLVNAWGGYRPISIPQWPGEGRVAQDDELSQSSQELVQTPPAQPAQPAPQPPQGFTTPIPTDPPQAYVGVVPQIPLEQRTGIPSITEQQIINLLTSQQLTSTSRTREANPLRPHMMRQQLPISTAYSNSAQQT